MATPGLSRRRTLTGAAGLGIGLPVLAACGEDEPTSGDDPAGSTGSPTESAPSSSESVDASPTAAAGLAAKSDIPVGGGVVFADAGVVVTQPEAGQFKGFDLKCTHNGCAVNQVTDTINCPCHGSKFSIVDGAPQAGPAAAPLGTVALTTEGDQISLG